MSSNHNVNKIIIVGNLGADPDLRYTARGNAVVNLAIATNRSRKNTDGSYQEETEWHRAVVWGKRAESCKKYLGKGHRVYIEGFLRTNKWQDPEGQKRWKTEVLVNDIKFLSVKQKIEDTTVPLAEVELEQTTPL